MIILLTRPLLLPRNSPLCFLWALGYHATDIKNAPPSGCHVPLSDKSAWGWGFLASTNVLWSHTVGPDGKVLLQGAKTCTETNKSAESTLSPVGPALKWIRL